MIYFMRHGESEANARHVFAGQRDDSHLTKTGREQARQAAAELIKQGIRPDRIVVSPLDRTEETAAIVAADLDLDLSCIEIDRRIEEYDMGAFSGMPIHPITSAEITAHPEAEDPRAFQQRVMTALTELKALPGTTLVVSHDGVGRMIEAAQAGGDPTHFYDMKPYPHCEPVELTL